MPTRNTRGARGAVSGPMADRALAAPRTAGENLAGVSLDPALSGAGDIPPEGSAGVGPDDERCAKCGTSPVNPETPCTIDPITGLCQWCTDGQPEGTT